MTVRFSVCICTHNRSDLLGRCLESLLRQQYPIEEYEVVVVDNASEDGTAVVISKYAAKAANMRSCYEPEIGLSKARNRAGGAARGEWLAYLDDDAIAPPGWLAAARRAIETAEPDLTGGPVFPFYDAPKPAWFSDAYGTIGHGEAAALLQPGKYLLGGNLFMRREVFEESEGFPTEFGMRGKREYYGDETAFQNRLRRSKPNLKVYYDPALAVSHRVAAHKMRILWRLRYRFNESRAGYRVHHTGYNPIRLEHFAAYLAMPAVIFGEGTLGVLLRDRRKYPGWQNYYYEAIAARAATWGRLHERILQGIRRMFSGVALRKAIHRNWRRMISVYRRRRGVYLRRWGLDLRTETAEPLNRRALLAYIVHPFEIEPDDARFFRHINIWHAREMVRVLNEMGFCVDAIDYRDQKFRPEKRYDLFIGHGGINFSTIAGELPAETGTIYFSTGAYWQFHNREEMRRFADLTRRRVVTLPPDRPILHSEEEALRRADGILGIGNDFTRATYADFKRVKMIDGTSLNDPAAEAIQMDYSLARNHFLFFASHGNVHKGLDLLIDAFAEAEAHLWIMAPIESRFQKVYREELNRCANIHLRGWTQPRSTAFYETVERCVWCILPSCSEGQAQAVIETLKYGLIPLVSRAAGVDVEDFGEIIEPITVENIRMLAKQASQMEVGEVQRRSQRARAAAAKRYSEAAFGRNFRDALESLTAQPVAEEEQP